jgi:hypothetical protein
MSMDEEVDGPERRREAVTARRAERDRALEAIHSLETALGKAGVGPTWSDQVAQGLKVLGSALTDELTESARPDALLTMVAAENPRRFQTRIEHLRQQLEELAHQVESLGRQVQDPVAVDVSDLRHRVGSVIRAVHQYQAREADVVYEAIELDLG